MMAAMVATAWATRSARPVAFLGVDRSVTQAALTRGASAKWDSERASREGAESRSEG